MVDAMASLAKHAPDARLAWAGSFVPASFEMRLRSRPGWGMIDYRGKLDRLAVANLLGASRAGLVVFHPAPNHMEAQPNKLFEYMAAGLPVVASDFPLWKSIVSETRCGLLVDPRDPAAIAKAILWILEHPREAEAMGRRGQAAVARTYSWESEAKKLVTFYAKLLASSEPVGQQSAIIS